jgi:hypothetical protein
MSDGDFTVEEIIELAGGAPAIAEATLNTPIEVKTNSVYKWKKIGIPERFWDLIMKRSSEQLTVSQIYSANRRARAEASSDSDGGERALDIGGSSSSRGGDEPHDTGRELADG